MTDADLISRERLLDGRVFAVDRDEVRLPHGPTVKMDIVRHAKSVVLLPVPEAGHVILIRQYRHAVNQWLWELPAGSVDEGETPEAAATRECHEEIGQVPETVVRLGALYPTPGYCDEEMVFFRVSALRDPTEAASVDEDEHIEARTFSVRDAREMARHGEILDMKTVVGLAML
ncbi:MAG: NUDIX hydrolase [Vicinamibacterales bacterium]